MQLMGGVSAASIAAVSGADLLSRAVANASPAVNTGGKNGVKHVVILMMENRSFDHFLGWVPGADGRHDLSFLSADGNVYPNYPLAPDFQGCGYSDPDHSFTGFLLQHNFGKNDGFLLDPTTPENNPGVKLAAANTFPIGYYTNFHRDGRRKLVPDLPVTGALAERYTLPDRYFCSFAGETFPNRFYQHAARTDRDFNIAVTSKLPTIWDQLSPIPNSQGIPTGAYFFRDLPFLGLWGAKYIPFWHPFYSNAENVSGVPLASSPTFLDLVKAGNLPNVSFIDPAFDTEGKGTSADNHPLADVRLGERFIADAYHALASAGYLDDTVFVINYDEWGGFYEHVSPPKVIDNTDPATVNHTGDPATPVDGQTMPDYRQLGFRVPTVVVSNLTRRGVHHDGPLEHSSNLKLIEETFGLSPLTARDANAVSLGVLLEGHRHHHPVDPADIPTSDQVVGPVSQAAAACSETSVQSVSPEPLRRHYGPDRSGFVAKSGSPTGAGMARYGQELRKSQD
jgi:phospholipase C